MELGKAYCMPRIRLKRGLCCTLANVQVGFWVRQQRSAWVRYAQIEICPGTEKSGDGVAVKRSRTAAMPEAEAGARQRRRFRASERWTRWSSAHAPSGSACWRSLVALHCSFGGVARPESMMSADSCQDRVSEKTCKFFYLNRSGLL